MWKWGGLMNIKWDSHFGYPNQALTHNIILYKYCKKDIVAILHYMINGGIAFVVALIVTLNLQWCKYCKLGLENKMGHAHIQCLHVKMKLLLVDFVLI